MGHQPLAFSRDDLLQRAGRHCEYCLRRLEGSGWEVEHTYPRWLGGASSFTELAVSCSRCNRNKGGHVHWRDPVTGTVVPLFNPRQENWSEHFRDCGLYIIGKTAVGRATASLLFRSTRQYLPKDLRWDVIADIEDENLHSWLNHQRARRLWNEFAALERQLKKGVLRTQTRESSHRDREIATHATQALRLEMLFTRARPEDVTLGLRAVRRFVAQELPMQLRKWGAEIQSVLLQQKATLLKLHGQHRLALRFQMRAVDAMEASLASVQLSRRQIARLEAVRSRAQVATQSPSEDALHRALDDAQAGEPRTLTCLADAELYAGERSRIFDRLASATEMAVSEAGYGQGFDFARGIAVRRRWWGLKALNGDRLNMDLLLSDLELWRKVQMENELRELGSIFIAASRTTRSLSEAVSLVMEQANVSN